MILYANGCSLTEGAELVNPHETAWPVVLAKKLNMECINDGLGASSNERIFRTTYEFMFNNIINNNNIVDKYMIVIGWSTINRYEIYSSVYESYLNVLRSRYNDITVYPNLLSNSESKIINDFFKICDSRLSDMLKTLNYITIVINLCKFYNIPCVMFNSIREFSMKGDLNQYVSNNSNKIHRLMLLILDQIDYLSNQKEWCSTNFTDYCIESKFPLGKYFHPLEEAHSA